MTSIGPKEEPLRKLKIGASLISLMLLAAGCGGASRPSAVSRASGSKAGTVSSSAAASGPYGSSTSGTSAGVTSVALITTKRDSKLGMILAYGPKRLTVYMFEADRPGSSRCTGACARVWPPVTGEPKALAGALSAELGTIMRADGTRQVTYKGHPLYLYIGDKDDGDTYGEGIRSFGAEWYALSPSGEKVDRS
jgi:predicted lipoprotein with Yx(FWY)xxD motif